MPPPDRQRLIRLNRLERIRAIARQTAAAEAAQAEGTLAQLLALAERTGRLADDYAVRSNLADAAALRGLSAFRAGLDQVSRGTLADASRARTVADRKLVELAEAERRRQSVEDRARAEAKALAASAVPPALAARKALGTKLE